MANDVYIVTGNHQSVQGINEITFCIYKSLSKDFSVKLTPQIKNGCVNIFIDEFSNVIDAFAIERARRADPDTKVVIIATEFITPASLFGAKLTETFNFFGSLRDWRTLLIGGARALVGGRASYLYLRYAGFVRALKHCDLVASVHADIPPGIDQILAQEGIKIPSVMIYPEIGGLSAEQRACMLKAPFGFSMTGTITPYRHRIMKNLIHALERVGCLDAPFGKSSFQKSVSFPASNRALNDRAFSFGSSEGDYLFNINPPQSRKWPYSSPMRIYRAVMRGQIPVITKKFGDHPIEEIAMVWDDTEATSRAIGAMKLSDRSEWIETFAHTLIEYNKAVREANSPFVNAMQRVSGGADARAPNVVAYAAGG